MRYSVFGCLQVLFQQVGMLWAAIGIHGLSYGNRNGASCNKLQSLHDGRNGACSISGSWQSATLLRDAQLNIQLRREIYGGAAAKLQQLSALTTLFGDYAPTLFYMGYRVRTLHWRRHAPWSGKETYDVVQFFTVLLYALRPRGVRRHYMDASLLWLLQWDPYMDALPSAAFSEEKLEATMSQLQQAPMIVPIQDHEKQYRFLNRNPNEPKDPTDPHVPRTFRARVVVRAQRLINAIQNGTVPFMPLHADVTTTKGVPPAEWPADYVFPERPWNNPDDTEVKMLGV